MVKLDYEKLRSDVDAISIATVKELVSYIRTYLDKCGLFYKCFIRIKSGHSLCEKLRTKLPKRGDKYKLQDLVGIRIVVYFKEDISLCEKLIDQHFHVLNISKNADDIENFGPQRINYVCAMPDEVISNFDMSIWDYPIDKSFEIQVRTIFSEGWHEIEHDFRYKCQDEWKNNTDLSRTLNGIFATLDNCDWAIASLFTQIAYRHYKSAEWIPMLKNVFKIRIEDCSDLDEILKYFSENKEVAKKFFRLDRDEFLIKLSDLDFKMPLKMKNVIFLANLFQIHDTKIEAMTPDIIKKNVEKSMVRCN
jgi:putative GTP pyrophosphokinase